MRSLRWPLLLLLPLAASLRGDYVALELSRSPYCLIGADVTVSVAPKLSMVEGKFVYRYVPRFDYGPRSPDVRFEFPVFVPAAVDTLEEVEAVTQMKVRFDGVDYDPVDLAGLRGAKDKVWPYVPKDFNLVLLVFRLPRSILQEHCTLQVHYFQPHGSSGGHEVSPYLPLMPDFEALKNELLFSRLDFTVEFDALEGVRLHRLSTNSSVAQETPAVVKIHPADREIIAVGVIRPAAKGTATSTPAGGGS